MNRFIQLLDKGSAQILAPLKRFPIASFIAFIFILMVSIKMSFDHSSVNQYDKVMEKIAVLSLFGFFFLLGVRLMTRNILVSLFGVVILVGIFFYLPESLDDYISHQEEEIIFPMLSVGLISFIIAAPFINHKASNREFFEWLKALLYTTLFAAFTSIVFYLILRTGTEIVSGLFDLNFEYRERAYRQSEYLFFISYVIFAPYIFLASLPQDPTKLHIRAYNRIEEIFFKYFLSGLFIAYFIIIYTYLGKMILLSEYPKGMVSINIIAFSALALMTYLFWTPLWNEKNSKYKKVIWIAIILQLVLLVVALYLRVNAYGWTFGRLVLSTFGVWLFGLSFYALFKKEVSFRGIFLAVPFIIILNLLFAPTISKSSQQEKLGRLLSSQNKFSDDTNISLRYNISSTIEYLYGHYGTDALFALMPNVVSEFNNQEEDVLNNCTIPVNKNFPMFATEKLGFKYIDKWTWQAHVNRNEYEQMRYMPSKIFYAKGNPIADGLEVKGYEELVRFSYQKSEVYEAALVCDPNHRSTVQQLYAIKTDAKQIIIEKEKKVLASIEIEPFTKEIIKLMVNNKNIVKPFNDSFTAEEFTHLYEDEKVKVKLLFNSFGFTMKNELIRYSGLMLIQKKNTVPLPTSHSEQ